MELKQLKKVKSIIEDNLINNGNIAPNNADKNELEFIDVHAIKDDNKIIDHVNSLCTWLKKNHSQLIANGFRQFLPVYGMHADKVKAVLIHYFNEELLFLLPIAEHVFEAYDWHDTHVLMPPFTDIKWQNLLLGTNEIVEEKAFLNLLLKKLPFAVLKPSAYRPKRLPGILMHITSLPGKYGMGDFGREAHKFIDFLSETGQRYWQVLPLNPTIEKLGFSPYSSSSAFACNPLFIEPDFLVELGLLDSSELRSCFLESNYKANFEIALKNKNDLWGKAYNSFKGSADDGLNNGFKKFIEKESYWLNDYALFVALKVKYADKAWYKWPEKYKKRDEQALAELADEQMHIIEKCKFTQYLVHVQWNNLKQYANKKRIGIFGDVPIYVGYDSVDVWAHQDLFELNADGSMKLNAGVPPDYFNADGQLWNMPIFNWKKHQETGYQWWINRIRKNLQWFDLLRLDHFRGFAAYWAVPAKDKTAINGQWQKGPGNHFFETVIKHFPDMPFVAEDLGDIDEQVYNLRDAYALPGMKVLQFAFGHQMELQPHTPHNYLQNYIAYTGTHDNNTTLGWYKTNTDDYIQNNIKTFTGIEITEKSINKVLIGMAYASVAKLAIIPMQDWLNLDEKHRMNFPATTKGNWTWRMGNNEIKPELAEKIKTMVKTYGRY